MLKLGNMTFIHSIVILLAVGCWLMFLSELMDWWRASMIRKGLMPKYNENTGVNHEDYVKGGRFYKWNWE